jgi:chromosome segregation ATPase
VTQETYQPLPDKVLPKLKEIAAWLEKDVQDQFNDLHHFEEMFESISQELPEDIRASLSSVYDLEPLYVPLRRAWRKLRSRPAIEKRKTDAEHAMNGAQSQAENHKDALANLQASYDLKVARKAALEAELRSLSAEIEIDKKKIAELPGLIAKTQAEVKSAITKIEQCDAELTDLSGAQKDCQEMLDNSHLIISNVRRVLAKLLNA